MFQDSAGVSSSRVKMYVENQTFWPLNIGHQSTSDTTPHPRIMETSNAPLQKPIKLASVLMYSIKREKLKPS
jgi:hypothetical protein